MEKKIDPKKIDPRKFKLLYDNVLVKAIKIEAAYGLKRSDQYDDKDEYGEVLAVGEGRLLETGQFAKMRIQVGDIVLFGKYSTEPLRHNGEDYLLLREEDIKAITQ